MCQAIVGCQSSYDHIMSVDVTCRFVATMLSISPKQLNFNLNKVGPKIMSSTLSIICLINEYIFMHFIHY